MESILYMDNSMMMIDQHSTLWMDAASALQSQPLYGVGTQDLVSPSASDAAQVLRDWTLGYSGDQVTVSPTSEFPQDWLETFHESSPVEWVQDVGIKRRHLSSDEDLLTVVSPGDVIFHPHANEYHSGDDSELVSVSYPVSPNSGVLLIRNEYELFCDGFGSAEISLGDDFDSSSSSTQSPQQFVTESDLEAQSDAAVLQQVPNSPDASELEQLDSFDCESSWDPENVFTILQHLSAGLASDVKSDCFINLHPALSPVSLEEVDCVLSFDSSEPVVPKLEETGHFSTVAVEQIKQSVSSPLPATSPLPAKVYKQHSLTMKSPTNYSSSSSHTSKPYSVVETRRQKKKEQNKSAALRYRQKKREEKGVVLSEVDQLQLRNTELKEKVENLNREIGYLRGLIAEIYEYKD